LAATTNKNEKLLCTAANTYNSLQGRHLTYT